MNQAHTVLFTYCGTHIIGMFSSYSPEGLYLHDICCGGLGRNSGFQTKTCDF